MISKQEMKQIYHKEKLSFSKMSIKTGLSVGRLQRTFHKYGLKPIKHDVWNKGINCYQDSRILSGKNHPRWKDASKYYLEYKTKRKKMVDAKTKCSHCSKLAYVLHHIDKDTRNNDNSNLLPLCKSCHTTLHNKERGVSINKFKCLNCGKQIILKSNNIRKAKFCSLSCSSKYNYYKGQSGIKNAPVN